MDDWITLVYGRRMRKGPWRVHHLVNLHGTRYDVDKTHEGKLAGELASGMARIRRWLER